MSRTIPVPSEPLLTRTGQINPIWWRYLRGLESQGDASGVQEQIRDILRRLAEIPESREVIGRMSVVVIDQPDGTRAVQLDGDSLTPGANAFYCADANGRKQWAALSKIIGGSDGIVFTDSGYTIMGEADEVSDLPAVGNEGQAWWVGAVLYAWDGIEAAWMPDYSPSGDLRLTLIPGANDGDTLLWQDGAWGVGPSGIPDAPSDGTGYVRKDGAWASESGGGSGLPDAPSDGKTYGRKDANWAEIAAGGGGVQSVVAGTGISVDNTDPENPIVSAAGGASDVLDVSAPTVSSGTLTIDFAGKTRYVGVATLNANVTTLAFANLPGAGKFSEYELHIAQDGTGSRTFAIPASHKALGGSDTAIAPAANAVTVLSASTVDNGTTWRYAMQDSA